MTTLRPLLFDLRDPVQGLIKRKERNELVDPRIAMQVNDLIDIGTRQRSQHESFGLDHVYEPSRSRSRSR